MENTSQFDRTKTMSLLHVLSRPKTGTSLRVLWLMCTEGQHQHLQTSAGCWISSLTSCLLGNAVGEAYTLVVG